MRIVDLTLPINRHMKGIPQSPAYAENPTRCVILAAISEAQLGQLKGRGFEIAPNVRVGHSMQSRLEIMGHVGTHIDAPCHFLENTWAIDDIPLQQLVKKARVIPLTHLGAEAVVTAEEVLKSGVDFDSSVIPILHTGWTDKTWGTDDFWGRMPYLHPSVSDLLVEKGVSAVGLDFFPELPFWRIPLPADRPRGPNHCTLLGKKIIIIQMLTNLGAIGSDDFTLVALPLRLEGMDGSPARVIAIVEEV